MVTETLQYYLFKLFKKISEKFANFYLTLTNFLKNLFFYTDYDIIDYKYFTIDCVFYK